MKTRIAVLALFAAGLSFSSCSRAPMQMKWDEPAQAQVKIYKAHKYKRGDFVKQLELPATFFLPKGRYLLHVKPAIGYLKDIGYRNPDQPNPILYGYLDVNRLTENARLAKVPLVFDKNLLAEALNKGILIQTVTRDGESVGMTAAQSALTDQRLARVGRLESGELVKLKLGDQDPEKF